MQWLSFIFNPRKSVCSNFAIKKVNIGLRIILKFDCETLCRHFCILIHFNKLHEILIKQFYIKKLIGMNWCYWYCILQLERR